MVFAGRVTSIKEEKTTITRFGKEESVRVSLIAHFAVDEAFKGISRKEVDVVTGGGGGDCGSPFEAGKSYLVYAWPNRRGDADDQNRISSTHLGGAGVRVISDTLSTGICSRTALLSDAGNDVDLIRALLSNKPETRIYGMVEEYVESFCETGSCMPKYVGPVKGVNLQAVSSAASYEAQSDAQGNFKFTNLIPGKYRIRLIIPPKYAMQYDFVRSEVEIEVTSGCFSYEMGFYLQTDTLISGRVIDADGKPVGRSVEVSLISADDANKEMAKVVKLNAYTDNRGYYQFDGVPPGRYVMGVSIADVPFKQTPYAKTYYPRGGGPASAQVINLSGGQRLTNLDFHLSRQLEVVTINGIVVDGGGNPVAGAKVNLYDTEDPGSRVFGFDAETDPTGHFAIPAFKTRRYQLHAWKATDYFEGTGRQSVPVEVGTDGPLQEVRLILNKPGVFRRQLQ